MERESIMLAPFVEDIVDGLRQSARRKKIVIQTTVPSDMAIRADREQLGQALLNLIDEAIRVSRPVGKIALEARHGARGKVMISIQDNGLRIKASDRRKVFERGVDIGLSVAKQIVAAHGGRIWVEGQDGAGTTVRFILPT